jgi:pyruvate kinase
MRKNIQEPCVGRSEGVVLKERIGVTVDVERGEVITVEDGLVAVVVVVVVDAVVVVVVVVDAVVVDNEASNCSTVKKPSLRRKVAKCGGCGEGDDTVARCGD